MCDLQKYRRASVDAAEAARIDTRHLEDKDASADDDEGERNGHDLDRACFEALIQND